MLKDSRSGWIADLTVGSKVDVSHRGSLYVGVVSLITALGVFLRLNNFVLFQ